MSKLKIKKTGTVSLTDMSNNMMFTIRLDVDLHNKFKVLVTQNRVSMTDVILGAINSYIAKNTIAK